MTTFAEGSSELADGDLARAYLTGDPDAFAALFRRYYPNLVAALRRDFGHGLAEEVAQETLARTLKSLRTYDQSRPLWPWLRTIAVRLARTEAGRRAAEVAVPELEERAEPVTLDLSESYATSDVLVRALRRIPARQQRALVLRYVEDRDPAEIARVMNIKRSALEQLLFRARNNLAREYAAAEAQSWMPGLAGLPLLVRLRELAASWQTRVAAGADAAMAVAGNVAIGLAIAASGAGAASPAATLATGGPVGGVPVVAAVPAAHPSPRSVAGVRRAVPRAVAATPDPAAAVAAAGTRRTSARPGQGDAPAPEPSTTIEPPKNRAVRGRLHVAGNPVDSTQTYEDDFSAAGARTRGESWREGDEGGFTCAATGNLCD